MSRIKDTIDYLFDYGLDIKNRKIHLVGEVDEEMAKNALKGIDVLTAMSSESITVLLNSIGGDVDQGFAIYDAIKRCPAHVTIHGVGDVMSMAMIILQAGDRRTSTPHTAFMTHQDTATYTGNKKSLKNWVKFMEWSEKRCNEIMAEKTGKSVAYWDKEHLNDIVMTADQALAMGLIDEILQD